MPAFLKDYSRFYGTGEKNEKGQTLDEFLAEYNAYKYKQPSCTADAVIFAYEKDLDRTLEGLKVLVVKRKNHPGIGFWALPGGFCNMEENLEASARRELEEETGVTGLALEQIAAFGDYDRDPRARVITTAFMSLVKESDVKVQAADDAADAAWASICLKETDRQEDENAVTTRYELRLQRTDRMLDTTAVLERTVRKGLIREEKTRVIDPGTTLSDHTAIILEAILRLRDRL